jgi:hypothetical protein
MCGDGCASGGNHPPMRRRQFNDKCISIETNVGCRFQQFVSKISLIDVHFAVLVDADSASLRRLSAPAERHHATEDEEGVILRLPAAK